MTTQSKWTQSRKKLAEKYFPVLGDIFEKNNMGLILSLMLACLFSSFQDFPPNLR